MRRAAMCFTLVWGVCAIADSAVTHSVWRMFLGAGLLGIYIALADDK